MARTLRFPPGSIIVFDCGYTDFENLKIITFVGTSPNALKTQILTALIALLILRFQQLKSTFGWSLSNLAAPLRMNLFVHRDLWSWLNEPFESPPELPQSAQLELIPI